jgi:hypothetical protein
LIGSNEFVQYHQYITHRVLIFLVVPLLLGTVFSVLLIWYRPAAIPLWAAWTAIVLQGIAWISTATVQVPIQLELSANGLSVPLIEQLIETNFWFRRVPYSVCAGLYLWMVARVQVLARAN